MPTKIDLAKVKEVISKYLPKQSSLDIYSRADIPKQCPYIYVIHNSGNILQIGQTTGGENGGRLVSLLPGAKPNTHNKSFIVGLANSVLKESNQFLLYKNTSQHKVDVLEKKIHSDLGIHTNKTPATFIEGNQFQSIKDINHYLWESFVESSHYNKLQSNEKLMAHDLVKLVSDYRAVIHRRNGKKTTYSSGDILSGNILMNLEFLFFTNLWEKMTNHYFQYSDYYRLSNQEYEDSVKSYQSIFQLTDRIKGNKIYCSPEDTVFQAQIRRVDSEIKRQKNRETYDDVLELDLFIQREQIEKAREILTSDNETMKQAATADIFIETNIPFYIFLITRPLARGGDKVKEILCQLDTSFKGLETIPLDNLQKCDRNSPPIKYKTDFNQCYIQVSPSGYKKKGKRWIDFS